MDLKKHPFAYTFLFLFLLVLYLDKSIVVNFFSSIYGAIKPFLYSIVIVYLLNPVTKLITRGLKHISFLKDNTIKGLSVIITYILVVVLVYVSIVGIIPIIQSNLMYIINHISEFAGTALTNIEELLSFLEDTDIANLESTVFSALESITLEDITAYVPYIFNTSSYILGIVYNIIIAFIISLYLIFAQNSVIHYAKRLLRAILGQRRYNMTIIIIEESCTIFNTFVIGKVKDSAIIGCILFVVMRLLNLDYSILLSVVVGITNMIPYLGPFIGGGIGVILFLSISLEKSLMFLVIIIILQQLDAWVIGVRVLNSQMGMSPLLILMSVLIGGALLGWFGMFIGCPVAQVIVYLLNLFIHHRELKLDLVEEEL